MSVVRPRMIPPVAFGLMILPLLLLTWSNLREFDQKAPFVETSGKIAVLDCRNHGHYQVTYTIAERAVTNTFGNLYLHGSCDALRLGEIVQVWYSAEDPNYASFLPPDKARARIHTEMMGLTVFPILTLVLYFVLDRVFSQRNEDAV